MNTRSRIRTVVAVAVVSAFVLLSFSGQAHAAIWSLADDFSLASNPNGAWSYELEDDAPDTGTYTPLPTKTRDANALWGRTFATPPTMWSGPTDYWGVGKNLTGVTQTSGTVSWAPGEILFHPKIAPFPARMVFSWEAPFSTTVDVDYSYSSATSGAEFGDGVGISIVHESGASPSVP